MNQHEITFDEAENMHRTLVAHMRHDNETYFNALLRIAHADKLDEAQEIAIEVIHHFPRCDSINQIFRLGMCLDMLGEYSRERKGMTLQGEEAQSVIHIASIMAALIGQLPQRTEQP